MSEQRIAELEKELETLRENLYSEKHGLTKRQVRHLAEEILTEHELNLHVGDMLYTNGNSSFIEGSVRTVIKNIVNILKIEGKTNRSQQQDVEKRFNRLDMEIGDQRKEYLAEIKELRKTMFIYLACICGGNFLISLTLFLMILGGN